MKINVGTAKTPEGGSLVALQFAEESGGAAFQATFSPETARELAGALIQNADACPEPVGGKMLIMAPPAPGELGEKLKAVDRAMAALKG